MASVSVAWGYVSRERLVVARPDFIIDEPRQLIALAYKDE
jgi:phosphoglycolate phosphatase-like HAD superfamily hydrolase